MASRKGGGGGRRAVAPAGVTFDRAGQGEKAKPRRGKAPAIRVKERPAGTGAGAASGGGGDRDSDAGKGKGKGKGTEQDTLLELQSLMKRKRELEKKRQAEEDLRQRKAELQSLHELGLDGAVDVMTTRTHGLAARLHDGHTLGVYTVDYTHDGKSIVSCSHDGSVVLWNLEERAVVRRYRPHRGAAFGAKFSPDRMASRVATVCFDGFLRVFDTHSGVLKVELTHPVSVQCLAWSPSGDMVATGSKDGTLTVWNVRGAEGAAAELNPPHGRPPTRKYTDFVQMVIAPPPVNPSGHVGTVRRVCWHSSNTLLSCSDDHTIRVWNARHMSLQRKINAHSGPVLDLAINSDGSRMVSASQDGTARIWMFKTGKCSRVLRGHRGVVYSAVFTAEGNGRRVITAGQDKCVNVHYSHDGTLLQRMRNIHKTFVFGLAAREDGLQFATAGGDHTVGLWRALPSTKLEAMTTFCKSCMAGLTELFRRQAVTEPDAAAGHLGESEEA